MRKIKALIYALLGGMVCWSWWQRGELGMALFIGVFTIGIIALSLSSIGLMKISWDDAGITLHKFPNKTKHLPWHQLEKMKLDHLGYHIKAAHGRFKIRRENMPEALLKRIKENIQKNQAKN